MSSPHGVRTHHPQPCQHVHQPKAHLSPSVYWGFITLAGLIYMGHFIELTFYIHFHPWKGSWLKPQSLNNIDGFLELPAAILGPVSMNSEGIHGILNTKCW